MKKVLVGTTWKMNKTVSESQEYVQKLVDYLKKNDSYLNSPFLEIFLLPTYLSIYCLSELAHGSILKYGAQNCCWADSGAFTGEISPMHLKDLGCSYVELGHAERREMFGEDNRMINKKVLSCLGNGLKPILCIGEEKRYVQNGDAFKVVKKQLLAGIRSVTQNDIINVIIAYEPVWAIGASQSAPIDFIYEAMQFLREVIRQKYDLSAANNQIIIYGGSVTPQSTIDILALDNNNGIFIGRAGLNLNYFIEMVERAAEIVNY